MTVPAHSHAGPGDGGADLGLDRGVYARDPDGGPYFYPEGGDIFAAFNDALADHGLANMSYRVAPGSYDTDTTLDLAGRSTTPNGWIDLRGASIAFDQAGGVAIDATGTHRSPHIVGGRLQGGSNTPDVGLLFARDDGGGSAGGHRVYGMLVDGDWNVAPYYNHASESCVFVSTGFTNSLADPEGAAIVSPDNHLGVTSPNVTIGTSDQVCTHHTFVGCEFQYGGTHSGATHGAPLVVRGGNAVRDINLVGRTFLGGGGTPRSALEFDLRSGNVERFRADGIRSEATGLHGIYIRGPASPTGFLFGLDLGLSEIAVDTGQAGDEVHQEANTSLQYARLPLSVPDNKSVQLDGIVGRSYIDVTRQDGSITATGTVERGTVLRTQTAADLDTTGATVNAIVKRQFLSSGVEEWWDGTAWTSPV